MLVTPEKEPEIVKFLLAETPTLRNMSLIMSVNTIIPCKTIDKDDNVTSQEFLNSVSNTTSVRANSVWKDRIDTLKTIDSNKNEDESFIKDWLRAQ